MGVSVGEGNPRFTDSCVCPGDLLIYRCTAVSYGLTIWTGSALNCPIVNNEIILRHGLPHYARSCNNGDIVAGGIEAEGNNFTSQLNITVTSNVVGGTVSCSSDNGTHLNLIFSIAFRTAGVLASYPP